MKLFKARTETVFYCHTTLDLQNWLPVQKYLKPIPLVSDKANTRKELRAMGYIVKPLPVYPKAVIMCRLAAHKFPSRKVIKIGMRHGAYHFKRMSKAGNFNLFQLYLFTSPQDLAKAKSIGVSCGEVGGFPKLDSYLAVKEAPAAPGCKKRLLFTATYDLSGMSAIHLWLERLPELTAKYDIYVSLHPWMSESIKARIAVLPGIHYVQDNPLPSICSADLCVVDTSSVIAEICALDKPLISWALGTAERSVSQITEILERCSIRISSFDELEAAIERVFTQADEHGKARAEANAIFFDRLDGKAGKRSAEHIVKLLPELKL